MEIKEMTIKMIREHLPTQGTELSCYTFLASDALWTGTVEPHLRFASDDDEYEEDCAKIEQLLRQQAAKIDPTAIEDTESLWSTLLEELGAGML